MHWLLFAVALVALGAGFTAKSIAAVLGFLLLALVASLAAAIQMLARRAEARNRDAAAILDPDQLRRLHERAEAERSAAIRD